jgi:hypothetical protein
MAIGVFGLQVAYRLKRLEVMSTDDTYGWFGGGTPSATVDRIDFSNDTGTANIRGPLSLEKGYLAATGNSNYGWFGGGFTPAAISTVDRIDFSNDSPTTSPRGPLSSVRYSLAATGNSNYGWFGGGFPGVSRVDRIDFSNDSSTASPRGPLSLARSSLAATGNSNYGWFGNNASVSRVDRIDFSNDSPTASIRGPLSAARYGSAATGNSNYGWFGGGSGLGFPPPRLSTVDRIDFSNDSSTASVRGPLSSARGYLSATGNSNYGWFGGGVEILGPAVFSAVDRIDFSNDSVTASPRGPLSSAKGLAAATSGQAKGPAIKLQKAGNYGWFGGGNIAGVPTSGVDRIDFSNDSSTASPRGPLSLARSNIGATGNSNYGWFGGGSPGPRVSIVDRIDFSNDSSIASPRGPLSSSRYNPGATGNSNYGWFGGGNAIGNLPESTVDRINFSNDSVGVSVRGSFLSTRERTGVTGNSNYGWFGGGVSSNGIVTVSTVDRINFANDSVSASPRGLLSQERFSLVATGNSNYGWFGGGYSAPAPGFRATVDRIDFANDSVTASPRGPLSAVRSNIGATGNSNYGWFGGGTTTGPAAVATVDRINFSNDSVSVSVRGSITPAAGRNSLAATSNTPT